MFEFEVEKLNKFKSLLFQVSKIALIGHTSPDGDSVASVMSLYLGLKKIFKGEVYPVLPDSLPNYMEWIEHKDKLIIGKDAFDLIKESDIVFCLDFNEEKRVGGLLEAFKETKAKKIIIDHHPNVNFSSEYLFSYPQASSTAEIVFYFLKFLDKTLLDRVIASYLFAGIVSDTGIFVHDSADHQTFSVVSKLLSYGVDKGMIIRNMFKNYSENRMRLMGYLLLKKMRIDYSKEAAVIILDKKAMRKFDFQLGDHETFANLPLSIKDVEVVFFIMQLKDRLKISLRSKGKYDVNKIARAYFAGGGHKNAAGGLFYGSLRECKNFINKKVIPNLQSFIT